MNNKIKPISIILGISIATSLSALNCSSVEASTSFKDVKSSHWAYSSINNGVKKGYISGYPGGKFLPGNKVTRAEFATFLSRLLPGTGVKEEPFSDVSSTHWARAAIEEGIESGFIDPNDFPNGKFQPDKPMTRGEMAKWMAKGLSDIDPEWKSALMDTKDTLLPITEYYKGGVNKGDIPYIAVNMGTGLLNGYPDKSFKPQGNTTRAEVSALLMRYINVLTKSPSSYSDLQELREVGTTGTNVKTVTNYTFGEGYEFKYIVGKETSFKNNKGKAKIHRMIVVDADSPDTARGIYSRMFIDEKTWYPKPKPYHVFVDMTFSSNADMTGLSFVQGAPFSVLTPYRVDNNSPQQFGFNTLSSSAGTIVNKGKEYRFWTSNYLTKSDTYIPFERFKLVTDDGTDIRMFMEGAPE